MMDGRLVLLRDRVQGMLKTWEEDARKLRGDIDNLSRENSDLLVYGALAKCNRGLEDIIVRIGGVSVILCILSMADMAREQTEA
ncbi:MAG: hypothetical protein IJT83_15180 [Victivallales bacterium]|nr:hypothetical protein [Victivallales bacterium]MBQ9369124.1 hypothetical protein [Victivallales bacterium]